MADFFKLLATSSAPSICLIFGLLFLLFAAIGRITGRINLEISNIIRWSLAVTGLFLFGFGAFLFILTLQTKDIQKSSHQKLIAEDTLREQTELRTDEPKQEPVQNTENRTQIDNIPLSNVIKHSGTLRISVIDKAGRIHKIDEVFLSCANGEKPFKFEPKNYFVVAIAKSCTESYINAHTVGMDRWLVDIWHFKNLNQPLASEDFELVVNGTRVPSRNAIMYADQFANFRIELEYIE